MKHLESPTAIVFENIKNANSPDEIKSALVASGPDPLIQKILFYTFSPLVEFNLSDWEPNDNGTDGGSGISKFMHVPNDIFENRFTEEESYIAANLVSSHISDEEHYIFVGMLKKHIDLGVDNDTMIDIINDVWPGTIQRYPLRKAGKLDEQIIESFSKPLVAQEMTRGLRVNVAVRGKTVTYKLGDGTPIEGWHIWDDQFRTLMQEGNTVLDGHAQVVDENNIVVETDNDAVLAADPASIRFVFWDAIRYDGFIEGEDTRIGYNWRFNGLEHMMLIAAGNVTLPCYRASEFIVVKNLKQARKWSITNDFDFVIKNLNATWKTGTTDQEMLLARDTASE